MAPLVAVFGRGRRRACLLWERAGLGVDGLCHGETVVGVGLMVVAKGEDGLAKHPASSRRHLEKYVCARRTPLLLLVSACHNALVRKAWVYHERGAVTSAAGRSTLLSGNGRRRLRVFFLPCSSAQVVPDCCLFFASTVSVTKLPIIVLTCTINLERMGSYPPRSFRRIHDAIRRMLASYLCHAAYARFRKRKTPSMRADSPHT